MSCFPDKKIMGIAVEGCIYKAAQMAPEEVSRVARGIAKAGIREPVFIEAIGAAAEASFPDMYPRQLCWVLWSFAKVGYKFPMESYSLAATTVSEGVEVTQYNGHICSGALTGQYARYIGFGHRMELS